MALIAVALGVAFIAVTMSLRTMLDDTFAGVIGASNSGDAYVRGAETIGDEGATLLAGGMPRNRMNMDLAETIATVDGVAGVAALTQGPVVLIGADGTAVHSLMAPSFAFGADSFVDQWDLIEGRMPLDASEVALEKATLEASGLVVGDETIILLAGRTVSVTVAGVLDPDGPMAGATLLVIDQGLAEQAFAPDGKTLSFEILAEPGVSEEELVARIAPVLVGVYPPAEVITGQYLRDLNVEAISEMTDMVAMFLMIFAGIALLVGGFIIANSFTMSVQQRTREYALLRAIGSSPRQVFAAVLVQATALGVLGSTIGVGLGFGFAALIRWGLEAMGMGLAENIPFTVGTVILSLTVGTIVSLAAAAVPARRAALVPPVEAMRAEGATAKPLKRRGIIGWVITTLGITGLVISVVLPNADFADAALFAGMAGMFLGPQLLMPVLAGRVIRVLAAPLVWAVRPLGRLARGNVIRNPRRTAATAGALMIGSALVALVSVISASFATSLADGASTQFTADLSLNSPQFVGPMPQGAVDAVAALEGVERVVPALVTMAVVEHETFDADRQVFILGFDSGFFGDLGQISLAEGAPSAAENLGTGEVLVNALEAEATGLALGDTVTMAGPIGQRHLTITGVFEQTVVWNAPYIVHAETINAITNPWDQISDRALIRATPGTDLDALHAAATAAVAPYFVVTVLDAQGLEDQLLGQVDMILTILYALLAMSVFIAILGIVNTLALSVIERTKEIGLLRAVGLGRLQLSGTVMIESVLTAVFGTLLGLGIGVATAAALPRVMAQMGLDTLSIPIGTLIGMVGLAIIVGLFAAVWPAIRASRLPVLEAISHE